MRKIICSLTIGVSLFLFLGLFSGFFTPINALCVSEHLKVWDDIPCGPLEPYPIEDAHHWLGFYDHKGTDWMEKRLTEMNQAKQNDSLEEWKDASTENYIFYVYHSITSKYLGENQLYRYSYKIGEDCSGSSCYEKVAINSPPRQKEIGIDSHKVICKDGLTLIQKYDGMPACVTPETKKALIKRGWADSTTLVSNDECSTSMKGYHLSKPLSEVYVQRLVLFIQPDSYESFCVFYKSNHENSGDHTLNPTLDTGILEEGDSSDVSITFEPKKVSLEYGSKTLIKYNVKTTPSAEGVYLIGIDQLGRLPVVVWEDRKSVGANEIPVYHGFSSSENKVLDSVLLWHDEDDSLEYVLAKIER